MVNSISILFVILILALIIFPTVISIVAFCMMMRMSEDIRWLRFKDDPGSKKPMPYLKVIVCCFAVSAILAVALASPVITAMSTGAFNLPAQMSKSSTVNSFG